jgi:hypothetical protein
MKIVATYTDLIDGTEKKVVFRGSLMERFFRANYRPGEDGRRCELCKYRTHNIKCEKVGVTESVASDIDKNNVCDFFKLLKL